MKLFELNRSGVSFDEREHRYFLDKKELFGITPVLHRQLFEDKYSGIPKHILEKAAEYGSNVHSTIELCDTLGDENNKDECYIAYRRLMREHKLMTIANEYIVTDKEHYASAIDITAVRDNDDLVLMDIKTTSSLDKEYISWQLSIYKHLFYLQNPHLVGSVKGLYAIWLPKKQYGKPAIIEVEAKDEALVSLLLDTDAKGEKFTLPTAAKESDLKLSEDAICEVIETCQALKIAKDNDAALKSGLLQKMQEHNVKSFKNERILLTRVIPTDEDSYTLDTARLKEELPDVYNKYLKKKSKQKESLRIKIY